MREADRTPRPTGRRESPPAPGPRPRAAPGGGQRQSSRRPTSRVRLCVNAQSGLGAARSRMQELEAHELPQMRDRARRPTPPAGAEGAPPDRPRRRSAGAGGARRRADRSAREHLLDGVRHRGRGRRSRRRVVHHARELFQEEGLPSALSRITSATRSGMGSARRSGANDAQALLARQGRERDLGDVGAIHPRRPVSRADRSRCTSPARRRRCPSAS